MLTKEECLKALKESLFLEVVIRNDKGVLEYYDNFENTVVFHLFKQLIEEHFGLQLTRSECDLIEFALKPLEEELGMDITLLIDKLRRIQNTLPKEEGVVTCVEID